MTEPKAILAHAHMCTDIIFLSGTVALVRTELPADRWKDSIDSMLRHDPITCILGIKWRASHMGGRPWALSRCLTAKQMQTVRAQAGARLRGRSPGSALQDLISTVSLNGPLGPEPVLLMNNIMKAVAVRMNTKLEHNPVEQGLKTGQWHMAVDTSTGNPSGQIKVLLGSSAQARELVSAFHQAPVRVGGRIIAVQVSNTMLSPMPYSIQGNGQGAPSNSRMAAPAPVI